MGKHECSGKGRTSLARCTRERRRLEKRLARMRRPLEKRCARIWRLLEKITGRPVIRPELERGPHWALLYPDPLDAFVRQRDVWSVTLPKSGTTLSLNRTRIVDLPDDFDAILQSDPHTVYCVEEPPPPQVQVDDSVNWAAPETLVEAPLFLSSRFRDPTVRAAVEEQRATDPEWDTWLFAEAFPAAICAAHAAALDPQRVRLGAEWLHATTWAQLEPGGPIVKVVAPEPAEFEPIGLPEPEYLQWLRAETYARASEYILARGREVSFDELTAKEAAGVDCLEGWLSTEVTHPVALTKAERFLPDGLLAGFSEHEVAQQQDWNRQNLAFHRRNLTRKLTAR